MTDLIDLGSVSLALPDGDGERATWPYVDRRRTVKMVDDHPLRRVSDARLERHDASRMPSARWLRRPVRWDSTYVLIVAALDTLAAVCAAYVATELTPPPDADVVATAVRSLGFLLIPVAWVGCVYLQRGYERRLLGGGAEEFQRVTVGAVTFFATFTAIDFATQSSVARSYVALVVPLTTLGSLVTRYLSRRVLRAAQRRGRCLTDVLLVGPTASVLSLAQQFRRERMAALRIRGACLPPGEDPGELVEAGIPFLGDLFHAAQIVRTTGIGTVAVTACAEMHGAALRQLAWDLESSGADLVVAPALLEITGPRLHLRPVAGLSLLHVEEPELSSGRRLLKEVMDRTLALAGCVVLAPVFATIGIAIRTSSAGPVFYRQLRIGRNGRQFCIYKFRSMYLDAESRQAEMLGQNHCADGLLFKVRDDPRVTPVGRWLRQHSLDELPQLFNVLRGEMSLVGPRPPLPSEVARYGSSVQRRLLVKPGLTGLWQVSGRSDLTWDESVRLDLRYVENWSFMLDISILWRTFFTVLRGGGAY